MRVYYFYMYIKGKSKNLIKDFIFLYFIVVLFTKEKKFRCEIVDCINYGKYIKERCSGYL